VTEYKYDQSNTTDVNAAAKYYLDEEGFAVLLAPPGEKEARVKGWPNLVLGPNAIDEEFPPGKDLNIVRVNGTNSGGRGDIDLDRPESLRVANYIIPEEVRRFGRQGQIPGHIEVKFADTVPRTTRYELPGEGDDRCVVELRADGSQTLLPPSVYPDGDRCVWTDGDVLEAHTVTIRGYVEDIAVATLLLMNYPGEGARHQFWLGAIGMLIKARHPVERIRRIVEATVRCANDPELRTRFRIIDTTMTKFMVGDSVAGKGKLEKAAPGVPQILKEWLGIGKITDSGLPHVVCNDRPLREVSDEATDALVAANDPPEVFARSGSLARIAQDDDGRPVIQDIDKDRLRYRMTRTAEYLKVTDSINHIYPPDAVVGDVMAAKAFSFPQLTGLTQSPALRADGTVLERPGYDKATGLFYYAPEGENLDVQVPYEPSAADVTRSVELLRELYCDFPFVDEYSFANMLALTVTPIVRPAYNGPTPLAVIDKPAMGTGASLLSEVVCRIATAQEAAMMSPPDNDEETRKQITSVLRLGRPVVVIDNLGSELKNPSWARLLTSTTWEDRILGHSKVATLPNRATWITTGNNIKIGGDLPRRCYWIRMDAEMEKPWDRPIDSFTHPDLLGWVADSRGKLLGAILTLARNWFARGKPRWTGRPPGSFESWARTVGGILQAAGIEGFLGNADKMFDTVVEGVGEWEGFLALWHDTLGETGITSKRLVELLDGPQLRVDPDSKDEDTGADLREVLPTELALALAEGGSLVSRKFGEAFAKKENVRHGRSGYRIVRNGEYKRSVLWSVVADDPGPNGKDTPVSQVSQVTHHPAAPGNFGEKQQELTSEYQGDTNRQISPGPPAGESPRLTDSPKPPVYSYTLVDNETQLEHCVEAVQACERVGLDLRLLGSIGGQRRYASYRSPPPPVKRSWWMRTSWASRLCMRCWRLPT